MSKHYFEQNHDDKMAPQRQEVVYEGIDAIPTNDGEEEKKNNEERMNEQQQQQPQQPQPPQERLEFDRQRRIPDWKQDLIGEQVALVLGVGGLGCSLSLACCRLGFKKLVLVDKDTGR